jgi:RimJ/RimL family protein N-acetyltransferase
MSESANDWLTDRPDETIHAEDLMLSRVSVDDIGALVTAINQSLEHLRPWMAWAQNPASVGSMADFVARADLNWMRGTEFQYVVRRGSATFAGACGLHARDGPGVLEIGYWVHVDHLQTGIATKAARGLTQAAFALPQVERIEIKCDAANSRSAAVPRKLGYHLVNSRPRPDPDPDAPQPPIAWAIDRM